MTEEAGRRRRRAGWLEDLLEHRLTRTLVAGLIVVSLLPLEGLEGRLRPFFLGAFGLEVVLRFVVLARGRLRRGAPSRRVELLFVLFDLLAWLSFLPLDQLLGVDAVWLRGLRLVRLLVLLRFSRELARDVWRVLTRREQLQQIGLVTTAVVALSFVAAVLLAQLRVPHDYDGAEGPPEDFWDQIWWSFRQVESPDNLVGNLDAHPIVLLISLGLTITGIFVFSYLIGVGTNVVEQVLRAERRRPVPYRDHTLVVGPMHESELLVREYVRIYDKNRALRRPSLRELWRWLTRPHQPRPRRHALPRMALLGPDEEPPGYLYEPEMRWVVYREGDPSEPESLDRAAADTAKRAILLAPRRCSAEDADAITLARLAALRAVNPGAHAFVEIRDSANLEVAEAVGGPGTFPLDVSRFLGLFLCHHLLVPGIETLMGELLSAKGHEVYTHLFVDREEHRALGQRGSTVPFTALARHAHEKHGVTLLGVFLGERLERGPRGLVPVDRAMPWVNPLVAPEPEPEPGAEGTGAKDTGAKGTAEVEPGQVELGRLQGVFAIGETYLPVRTAARELASGRVRERDEAAASKLAEEVDLSLQPPVRRVLVVGFSRALPELTGALAHFVDGVEVDVWFDGTPAEAARRRAVLQVDGGGGRALERGGRLRVHHHPGPDLAEHVAASAAPADVDAVVFLADPESADVDARSALRVLRFARAFEPAHRIRLLVELEAVGRGEHLERHLGTLGADRYELVRISTERILNYFMVHSAFVPGVTAIYERLLGSRGQELVRLPLTPSEDARSVSFAELRDALATRSCVPIGVETAAGLQVNPGPGESFARRELVAVYALAETEGLEEVFPPPRV